MYHPCLYVDHPLLYICLCSSPYPPFPFLPHSFISHHPAFTSPFPPPPPHTHTLLSTFSITITGFTVQSSASSNTISRTLTTSSLISVVEQQLVINLGQADMSAIKLTAGLAKTSLNAYYSILFRSASDIAGNAITTVPTTAAQAFNTFIPDTVPPQIIKWSLDMTLGVLTIVFTEPILANVVGSGTTAAVANILVTEITLQSTFSRSAGWVMIADSDLFFTSPLPLPLTFKLSRSRLTFTQTPHYHLPPSPLTAPPPP